MLVLLAASIDNAPSDEQKQLLRIKAGTAEGICRVTRAICVSMRRMARRIYVITGTDTGVGKTVLAALLAQRLRDTGHSVATLKPLCSGGRGDARALQNALARTLHLDEINPWHFSAPLTPLLSARREGKRVRLADVLAHARRIGRNADMLLIEGAGGLLSPLGIGFTTRELVTNLRAIPIVVSTNRLGAINQVMLVLAALPKSVAQRASVVLVSPLRPNTASRSNVEYLREVLGTDRVHILPWLKTPHQPGRALANRQLAHVIDAILQS